jgi:hypothetical protein
MNKTEKYKLDERNHVEKPLLDNTSGSANRRMGKVRVTPLLEKTEAVA